ncbi:MAG: hypothetical protein H6632_16010 [Anaerolineales bacterium]|nr:hypothetical protein [Anaerolineales bacterium]
MNGLTPNNQGKTHDSASNTIADIRDFGAVEGDNADNADALEAAILSGLTVRIPKGDWRIASNKTIVPEFDVKIIGEAGARLVFDNALWQFTGKQTIETKLSLDASRGDMKVTLPGTRGIQPDDIIVVQNSTVAETQWNYIKSCTSLVLEICGNSVTLAHPLNFDFGASETNNTVTIYRSDHRITLENITLQAVSRKEGKTEKGLLEFCGLMNVTLRDIVQVNNQNREAYSIAFLQCVDCHVENAIIFYGLYPYQLNTSRNITFDGLRAYNSGHVVTPALWTDGVYINNLFSRGCRGGVEAHPSFNIHYSNVDVVDVDFYSNLRCVGGSIRNGTIRHTGKSSYGPYFHNVELVDKSIYDDYDFVVEGLLYDQDDKLFGPMYGRRFIIRDSELRGGLKIGEKVGIKEAHIENCIYDLFSAQSLPLLNTHNTTQHFELNEEGRYELRLYEGKVNYTKNKIYCQGDIFIETSPDTPEAPLEATLRVYDHWLQQGLGFISGTLKLRAWVRHGNVGVFDILEHHYHFLHKIAGESGIFFPETPAFESEPTGQDNETLAIDVGNIVQQGSTQVLKDKGEDDFTKHYFELKVTVSSGRDNPTYGLNYELELFRG